MSINIPQLDDVMFQMLAVRKQMACIVCVDRPRDALIHPCSHYVSCQVQSFPYFPLLSLTLLPSPLLSCHRPYSPAISLTFLPSPLLSCNFPYSPAISPTLFSLTLPYFPAISLNLPFFPAVSLTLPYFPAISLLLSCHLPYSPAISLTFL